MSSWQEVNIDCSKGLIQNRQQAIVSTNDGVVLWPLHAPKNLTGLD